MAKKKLNVGMVGYGFMGRTHSNAFRKVGNFFDTEHQPVLKAICGRNEAGARAFGRLELALGNDTTGGQPPLIQADMTRFRREIGEPRARDIATGIRDVVQ